jgi:hypothetical protein
MIDKVLDLLIAGFTWIFYALVGLLWVMLATPLLYHLIKFILRLFK